MISRELLVQYLEERRESEFDFETFNCGLFAADWIARATGTDYAKDLRGLSHVEAYRIVAEHGSLGSMITALLGRDPIAPALAMRGDIVLGTYHTNDGASRDTIGICETAKCFFPRYPKGLVALSRSSARLAWRVG